MRETNPGLLFNTVRAHNAAKQGAEQAVRSSLSFFRSFDVALPGSTFFWANVVEACRETASTHVATISRFMMFPFFQFLALFFCYQ